MENLSEEVDDDENDYYYYYYWAREASYTLVCSIDISLDIYICDRLCTSLKNLKMSY